RDRVALPDQPQLPGPPGGGPQRGRVRPHGGDDLCDSAHPLQVMQKLLLLGLNHTTAPLEVRERLAFSDAQRKAAVLAFRERFPQCEAVLLSTCNRVELYVGREGHGHPGVREMTEFLA